MKLLGVTFSKANLVLLGAGLYGLLASFVLTYDKLQLLKDPSNTPPCSINPIVSCTGAMNSSQAEIFGITNSVYGIMAYTALLTVTALLLAGTKLPKIIWQAILAAALLGTAFMLYLFVVSVFILHVICPWCFGIWITTIPLLVAVLLLYYRSGAATKAPDVVHRLLKGIAKWRREITVSWLILTLVILLVQFWDYWATLL